MPAEIIRNRKSYEHLTLRGRHGELASAVPQVLFSAMEQLAPALPWSREWLWERFWKETRFNSAIRQPRGDGHDAGVYAVLNMWRCLAGIERKAWFQTEGAFVHSVRVGLREGAIPWTEETIEYSLAHMERLIDENRTWESQGTWAELAEMHGRNGATPCKGAWSAVLDVDPYLAAIAYTNGWLHKNGPTLESVIQDGIRLVETSALTCVRPVWGDGGHTMTLKIREPGIGPLTRGCHLGQWMREEKLTPAALAEKLGVPTGSVYRWLHGTKPQPLVRVALKALSCGLLTEASYGPHAGVRQLVADARAMAGEQFSVAKVRDDVKVGAVLAQMKGAIMEPGVEIQSVAFVRARPDGPDMQVVLDGQGRIALPIPQSDRPRKLLPGEQDMQWRDVRMEKPDVDRYGTCPRPLDLKMSDTTEWLGMSGVNVANWFGLDAAKLGPDGKMKWATHWRYAASQKQLRQR